VTKHTGIRGFVTTPRLLMRYPQVFGKTDDKLLPAEGVLESDPRFRAAQIQHRVSNAVRVALLTQGTSLREFAAELDDQDALSYERLRKIQSGHSTMQLADVFHWGAHFPAVHEYLAREQFGYVDDMEYVFH
jgi:hypothetical protein